MFFLKLCIVVDFFFNFYFMFFNLYIYTHTHIFFSVVFFHESQKKGTGNYYFFFPPCIVTKSGSQASTFHSSVSTCQEYPLQGVGMFAERTYVLKLTQLAAWEG